jgi:hypothetical protein
MKNNKKLQQKAGILLMNILLGIAAYFVALQFNDGKLSKASIGGIFFAMALPNFMIGFVLRLFRHPICWQFLWMALFWLPIGIVLMLI